jgi:hypothetical protein
MPSADPEVVITGSGLLLAIGVIAAVVTREALDVVAMIPGRVGLIATLVVSVRFVREMRHIFVVPEVTYSSSRVVSGGGAAVVTMTLRVGTGFGILVVGTLVVRSTVVLIGLVGFVVGTLVVRVTVVLGGFVGFVTLFGAPSTD